MCLHTLKQQFLNHRYRLQRTRRMNLLLHRRRYLDLQFQLRQLRLYCKHHHYSLRRK